MNKDEKIIKGKLGLLELGKQLGNVSKACKVMRIRVPGDGGELPPRLSGRRDGMYIMTSRRRRQRAHDLDDVRQSLSGPRSWLFSVQECRSPRGCCPSRGWRPCVACPRRGRLVVYACILIAALCFVRRADTQMA